MVVLKQELVPAKPDSGCPADTGTHEYGSTCCCDHGCCWNNCRHDNPSARYPNCLKGMNANWQRDNTAGYFIAQISMLQIKTYFKKYIILSYG